MSLIEAVRALIAANNADSRVYMLTAAQEAAWSRVQSELAAAEAQPAPAPVAWRVKVDDLWLHGGSRDGLIKAIGMKFGRSVEPAEVQPLCAAPVAAAQPDSPKAASGTSLPDPHGCKACTHPACGRFDGPRHVECSAMADGACARTAAQPESAQPVAVPQGYALVPVEPTPEMWAAVNKLDDEMTAGAYDGKGCTIEQAWDCLLAAAPAAPAPQPPTDEHIVSLWGWSATAEAERTATTQQHAFARAIESAHGIKGAA